MGIALRFIPFQLLKGFRGTLCFWIAGQAVFEIPFSLHPLSFSGTPPLLLSS